jgi:hypothetical protein
MVGIAASEEGIVFVQRVWPAGPRGVPQTPRLWGHDQPQKFQVKVLSPGFVSITRVSSPVKGCNYNTTVEVELDMDYLRKHRIIMVKSP